ncbi:BTB/POZ domain-containing protein [Usnea florida]
MVLRKDQIEAALQEERKLIQDGKLKEDNPLDDSETFIDLCEACRRGDLKTCQEAITEGVNINAKDAKDYTPLILASLCGHFEVVQLLLESGALCERDTFQGERCLYNALNDRIRNLLLSYDYSKSADPLQPLASHFTSLLTREQPQTADIVIAAGEESFHLHKFLLSARSPYFARKLSVAPDTTSWKLPSAIAPQAFGVAMKYVYFGEIPNDVGGGPGTGFSEDEVLEGINKISRQLEIVRLWDGILESGDRRLSRQRRSVEIEKGQKQLEAWFSANVLKHKIIIDTAKVENVKWDRSNVIFADVLLRADESDDAHESETPPVQDPQQEEPEMRDNIPISPLSPASRSLSRKPKLYKSVLFPVHRAMLLRSEYFLTMFSSAFREAQPTEYLQIIPIDCSPEVLEVILKFLYTEKTGIPLTIAIDVLFAADLLLIEKLKLKAAVVISTLGNGSMSQLPMRLDFDEAQFSEQEELDIYDVIRAGWLTRVPRLEEFGARYLAYRLESYIDDEEFADLVRESANRIKGRQETDTIELLDDIRYYLSERFRMRFEDAGLESMMEEQTTIVKKTEANTDGKLPEHEVVSMDSLRKGDAAQGDVELSSKNIMSNGTVTTLDGEMVGDELEGDAINYQILLRKIDGLLDRLKLDA